MKITKRNSIRATGQAPALLVELGFSRNEVYAKPPARGNPRRGEFFQRNASRLWDIAETARALFRRKLKSVHPDYGGSHEAACHLNALWAKLKRSFLRHGILLGLLSLCAQVQAARFAFDDTNSPPVTWVFYVGTNSGVYNTRFSVSSTNFSLANTNLFLGVTNYAVVTAVDGSGVESDPSNEINFKVPMKPRNFRLSLESSQTPAGPWLEQAWVDFDDYDPGSKFYRGIVSVQ